MEQSSSGAKNSSQPSFPLHIVSVECHLIEQDRGEKTFLLPHAIDFAVDSDRNVCILNLHVYFRNKLYSSIFRDLQAHQPK